MVLEFELLVVLSSLPDDGFRADVDAGLACSSSFSSFVVASSAAAGALGDEEDDEFDDVEGEEGASPSALGDGFAAAVVGSCCCKEVGGMGSSGGFNFDLLWLTILGEEDLCCCLSRLSPT